MRQSGPEVDVDSVFRCLATVGFPGPGIVPADLDEAASQHLLTACCNAGLAGPLQEYLTNETVNLSDEAEADLARVVENEKTWRDGVENMACTMTAEFTSAGIDHRFYKGVATARLVHSAGRRHYADADVLVPRKDFGHALEVARHAGFGYLSGLQRDPETTADLGVNLVRGGLVLDVHRALAHSPIAERIGSGPFRDAAATCLIGGRELPVLSVPALGVVAALEVALHDRPPKMHAIRDCLAVVADGHDLERTAGEWRVSSFVALGLAMAANSVERPDLTPGWASSHTLTRREHWVYRAYHQNHGPSYRIAALLTIPGLRDRLRFVRRTIGGLSSTRG